MVAYVIRRVLAMIPSLLGVALITFTLMHLTKGGPFSSEHSNATITARLMAAYHLDEPLWPGFAGAGSDLWRNGVLILGVLALGGGVVSRRALRAVPLPPALFVAGGVLLGWFVLQVAQGAPATPVAPGFVPGQFLRFLWNVSHADLGTSFSQVGRPVTDIIREAAANSFVLGVCAFLILLCLGMPLGIIAAVRQNSWVDYLASTISLIGYSIPNFVLGALLLLVTVYWLPFLPTAHWGDPVDVIMPAFVLAIRPMAVLMRLTRASMLEVLTQDYIRTAWAKGLGGRVVIVQHALRNAMLPVVTVMGDQLGDLVTGSLVVETLFNVPGIGQYFVKSVDSLDYGMIMGTTLFYAALVMVINLVVDLMYGVIDPRVRLGGGART